MVDGQVFFNYTLGVIWIILLVYVLLKRKKLKGGKWDGRGKIRRNFGKT